MVSPGKLTDSTTKASSVICDDKLGDDNFVHDIILTSPDKSSGRKNTRVSSD